MPSNNRDQSIGDLGPTSGHTSGDLGPTDDHATGDSGPTDGHTTGGTDPTHDHDRDSLERRLDAVERALADDEPLERADRLDDLESRVAELEAAVQALRGYVGSVRAVNEDVERRADRAFRKARAVERVVAPAEPGAEPQRDADTEVVSGHDRRGDADEADDDTPLARLRRRL